jgi:hypothetical protein
VISAGGGRRLPTADDAPVPEAVEGAEAVESAAAAAPVVEGVEAADNADTTEVTEPTAAPIVKEADPELEARLNAEEELERRHRQHHEMPHFRTGDE